MFPGLHSNCVRLFKVVYLLCHNSEEQFKSFREIKILTLLDLFCTHMRQERQCVQVCESHFS